MAHIHVLLMKAYNVEHKPVIGLAPLQTEELHREDLCCFLPRMQALRK
jgi:hypothetical protein